MAKFTFSQKVIKIEKWCFFLEFYVFKIENVTGSYG